MGSGYRTGWSVTSYMIGGILAWGGIGALLDLLAGFRWVFMPIGVVLGAALSTYLVYRIYGKGDDGRS
jgi:F0F1-type ATP synthase assembly protein I